jgi:hypothetical protein
MHLKLVELQRSSGCSVERNLDLPTGKISGDSND